MRRLHAMLLVILLVTEACLAAEVYDPIQFGADPDGKTLSTAAIQKAIDECAAKGGGTVQLKKGTYLSGTIFFRSGVTLQLDEGATLLGSTDLKDYPPKTPAFKSRMTSEGECVTQSLIYAEGLEKIALRGKGRIDGQGARFKVVKGAGGLLSRPFIIRMTECKDVLIEDVALRDSASWMQSYLACDNLIIRGIKIHNFVNANNDCIDIDGCQNVRISDVQGSSDDDGLCFKGTSLRPTKNVVVENCRFWSYSDSLKFGTDSQGGLEDIQIRNLELGPPPVKEASYYRDRPQGLAGMGWYVVDGGTMQNVTIDNIKIRGTKAPIMLRLGDRGRHLQGNPRLPPGVLRNVTISNVQAEGATDLGCPIAGLAGHRIENLTLRNITISSAGGGTQQDTVRKFDEKERAGWYPSVKMFGDRLPAFGLFFWHVKGLKLENVRLTAVKPDGRPAIALEDAIDVTIDGQKVEKDNPPAGVMFLPAVATSPDAKARNAP
jgi:polygalacturonase